MAGIRSGITQFGEHGGKSRIRLTDHLHCWRERVFIAEENVNLPDLEHREKEWRAAVAAEAGTAEQGLGEAGHPWGEQGSQCYTRESGRRKTTHEDDVEGTGAAGCTWSREPVCVRWGKNRGLWWKWLTPLRAAICGRQFGWRFRWLNHPPKLQLNLPARGCCAQKQGAVVFVRIRLVCLIRDVTLTIL
jgi:hypothetical protein